MSKTRLNRLLVALLIGLLAVGGVAQAREAPLIEPADPDAAPNPPQVYISRSGSAIQMDWEHIDQTTTIYQVWRSEDPAFDPHAGQGTLIDSYSFSKGLFGLGSPFTFVDNGICGTYTWPTFMGGCRYPQNPRVTVTGDVAHNYFWVVMAGNDANELDFANRVGEFDFALVKAG